MHFAGKATPLSAIGVERARALLRVGLPEIWAIVRVETRGCGFLPDRRPKILFERHVFHRETAGRFDAVALDVSAPTAGGYGPGGAHQYDRLARAIALDRKAALRSASWGMGQIMGFNCTAAGFADAESMVRAMCADESAQLGAVATLIDTRSLDASLRDHDWAAFAAGYNGPDYAANDYDEKLSHAYAYYWSRLPDLRVRTAQVLLMFAGLDPGPVDGEMGDRTRAAVRAYQERKGLAVTGHVDDPTLASLETA